MKVIFLDFDGVLNSEKYLRKVGETGVVIDPARMSLLKEIVDKTGAKIVLTTSWREHWEKNATDNNICKTINDIFKKHGLEIFDKTPKQNTKREDEIKSWLDAHPEVANFVVLDDMFLSAEFLDGHFVKTSFYFNGLDEQDVKNAIEILNG